MTAETEHDALHEKLSARIGTNVAEPNEAVDEVNMAMIRQWTDAFGDRNPIYEDQAFAATTGHNGLIAPPAMMQTWTMGRPILENLAERGGLTADIDPASPLITLDEAGYIGALATNSEYEFIKPVRLGDKVSSDSILESISPRKKTGLGLGYFITWVSTYRNQNDEMLGRQRFTLFKFDPATMGA